MVARFRRPISSSDGDGSVQERGLFYHPREALDSTPGKSSRYYARVYGR